MSQPSRKQNQTVKSVQLTSAERAARGKEQTADPNPEPNMMMFSRDLVVRLAEQHRLAITIRPDGSIFGLTPDLDMLRALVKDELARAAAKQAGGAA